MIYNFDEIIDRRNTNCVKYDGAKRYFGTEDIKPLWVADMDFKTPDFIIDSLQHKLNHQIFGYEEISDEYYKSIIKWQKRNALELTKDDIYFSLGVVSSLSICVEAFSDIDDEIVVQSPVYYPFYSVIENANRKVVVNNLREKDGAYYMDFDDLKKKITNKTKIIFLCSPHNPVGKIWTEDELNQLGEICLKHNIKIIADEIHSDIIFKPFISMASFKRFEEIVMVLSSPSKTFNIAGLSSSYVFSKNNKMVDRFKQVSNKRAVHGNSFSYCTTIAAYNEGEIWLNELLKYLYTNITYTKSFLEHNMPQITVTLPDATYLMWMN